MPNIKTEMKTKNRYRCAYFSDGLWTCWLWMVLLLAASFPLRADRVYADQHIYTAAAFGPDGRLWRLVPSEKSIKIDYSTDYGKTFSPPVRVNPVDKPIHSWEENPPAISVDKGGRVYVLYFADDLQRSTSFFSQSENGLHFSEPVKISSKADSSYHYQTEMLVGTTGNVHFMWHDARDRAEYKQQGGGDLSIYHVSAKARKEMAFPSDHRIAKNICSCCRTAMAEDIDGNVVILARFVYPGNIRDHGMFRLSAEGLPSEPWRVTFDDWEIEGCPTHGPALSISSDGRYHMTWFSQGNKYFGLFYAWSDDQGKTFSEPRKIGDHDKLPGYPDVLALGKEVALVWKVFDGTKTQITVMRSSDRGMHWSAAKVIAESEQNSAHPALITDGKQIFLSWNSIDKGFQLITAD